MEQNSAGQNSAGQNSAEQSSAEQKNSEQLTGDQLLAQMQQKLVDAVAKGEGSVVAIARIKRELQSRSQSLRFQMGLPNLLSEIPRPTDPDFVPSEYGSGVVVDSSGHILTTYRSLGDPTQHDYVVWSRKTPYSARVVSPAVEVKAGDPFSNMAILKVDSEELPPMTLGDAAQVRKGDLVIALGNPYAIARDGSPSASWGVISNLGRSTTGVPGHTNTPQDKETLHHFGSLLQTDAKLSLGCSGGALLNLDGEMVGLLTADTALVGSEEAAGLAIPVDQTMRRVIDSLKEGKLPDFGFLGIVPEEVPEQRRIPGVRGAYVDRVVRGLPGDAAGLVQGDVISSVNGEEVTDRNSLFLALSRQPAEATVQLEVYRWSAGREQPQSFMLPARLSKKYVATALPPFAQQSERKWRGMVVEYATALPAEMSQLANRLTATSPRLAALQVDPDTPAWRAGIRPGQGILRVGNDLLETPDQFYAAVSSTEEAVVVTLLDADDRPARVTVEAVR